MLLGDFVLVLLVVEVVEVVEGRLTVVAVVGGGEKIFAAVFETPKTVFSVSQRSFSALVSVCCWFSVSVCCWSSVSVCYCCCCCCCCWIWILGFPVDSLRILSDY